MRLSVLLLPVLVACGGPPPVDAPSEINELSFYLFELFDTGEDAEIIAGLEELQVFLDSHDYEANVKERSYTLEPLTETHWGNITGSPADPAEQVPVAVVGKSRHRFSPNRELAGETNHVCIESNTTVVYRREFLSDEACFLSGECNTLQTVNEVRKESFVAKAWYDLYKDYRVVDLDGEGKRGMIARSWTEDVFPGDGGNNSFDQTYILEAWLPAGGAETSRWFAMWSSVQIGGVDDAFYASLVESGIEEGYSNADNYIDGDLSYCNNDRDYAPERE